jgi:hypothetical protein
VKQAAEYKLRAERRPGEILAKSEKAKGARGIGKAKSAVPEGYRTQAATLSELGMSKKLSSRALKLAQVSPW